MRLPTDPVVRTRLVRALLVSLAAPLGAVVFGAAVSSVALLAAGHDPLAAFATMARFGSRPDSLVSLVNRATPLYLAGIAVALGFRMSLFNIGVEGQYLLAALLAASAGAAVRLPAPLHVALVVAVAMAVGAAWASIAALLKVRRNVHEVISTIMLNFVATGIGAYLLSVHLREPQQPGVLAIRTPEIPASGRMPPLNGVLEWLGVALPQGARLYGFVTVAIAVGAAYHVVVSRTRFGYDLRAAGVNPLAARASGVQPERMVVRTMLVSGAVAGMVGLPQVLGFAHRFTIDFPTGIGFTGIAVALVGRNHPLGVAAGALLFGFLERAGQGLQLERVPSEMVVIMQGSIVLAVVVAYQVALRLARAHESRAASRQARAPAASEVTA